MQDAEKDAMRDAGKDAAAARRDREKIRVLRVITWLPVGGIERKIVDVLPRLDPARFEVAVALIRERGPLADELEARGIPVHVIPFRRRWDFAALRKLARLMIDKRIEVVHSHMYRANLAATVAARMARFMSGGRVAPRVWCQVHNVNTWESGRQRAVDRFLCRWREGMIAVSNKVAWDVARNLAFGRGSVRVIYNGVDLERFGGRDHARAAAGVLGKGAAARAEFRAAQGAEPGDVVFLLAARLVEQKRPQDFIDLAARLLREAAAGKFGAARPKFWIAGDGPMRGALEAQAASWIGSHPDAGNVNVVHSVRDVHPVHSHPSDAIRFLGRRDDMETVMAAADVFVMTSTKEGFSNALLEAMASGLAIIATDVGGNAEAVRDGRDGFIIPPLDPERLHAAAARLLADAELRGALSAAALARAQSFSVEEMVRNVEGLYEETARGERRPV